MYSPFTCKSKFNRLVDDGEIIENVKEEIDNVFSPLKLYDNIDYYGTIGSKGIHKHELLESPGVLFNIARKVWTQAEDVLELDGNSVLLQDTHMFILDLLNFTRITLKNEHWANSTIRHYLAIFKMSIRHITDLEQESVIKLVAGTNRQAENAISQYFHLYLDTIWLLLTIDEVDVKLVITQLAYYSFKIYERSKKDYISCKCMKSVWLRLQLFCEHKEIDFWKEFNSALECYNEEFLIQFIPFIACLHCYNSDGEFVGSRNSRVKENLDFLYAKWNIFTKTTNQDLLKHLKSIEGLLCDLWLENAKLDFLYSTWDYFYKRLEEIELEGDLPLLFEKCRNNNVSDNSYLLFLRMLLVQLKKHAGYWNKFRGRIYTRFSPAKFAKLSDKGVFNLVLLMVVLTEVSFDEISSKILEFLQALPNDRKNTALIWKIYLILMELNIHVDRSIEPVADKLMPLIQEVSLNRSQFHLLSLLPRYMDRFTSITKNLKLKQDVFFNAWIENYTKSCAHIELLNFLNILIIIVERVIDSGVWYIYEKPLSTYVVPSLKRLAVSGVEMVGTLAGIIASNSPELQQIATWFSSENVPSAVISAFFTPISRNVDLPSEYDSVILKSWFQCAIIGEVNQDFTKYALSINMVRCLNLPCNPKFHEFIEFLRVTGNRECLKACFDGLEKWLAKHLEIGVDAKTNLIYLNMGIVFSICGQILYSRSIATCPLSKFIDLLLLPTEVLRGIKPSNSIIKAMQKHWHFYLAPIFEMSENDPYLERVAKDIVVRYIPLFDERGSPLQSIVPNLKLMTFVITKMNNDFFFQGSTRNEHTSKALSTIKSLLDKLNSIEHSKELVALVLPALYEVYMFKNQKLPAIDVLKVILQSHGYLNGLLQPVIKKSLVDVTKKHLPFNTSSYFQMMYVLTRIIPIDVKAVLSDIKDEIMIVESKRGQGFDNNLRFNYDKLSKMFE